MRPGNITCIFVRVKYAVCTAQHKFSAGPAGGPCFNQQNPSGSADGT